LAKRDLSTGKHPFFLTEKSHPNRHR